MSAMNNTTRAALLKAVRDVRITVGGNEYEQTQSGGLRQTRAVPISEVNRLLNSPEYGQGFAAATNRLREAVEWIVSETTSLMDLRKYVGSFSVDTPVPPLAFDSTNAAKGNAIVALRNLLTAVQAAVSMTGVNDTLQRAMDAAEDELNGIQAEQRTPARRPEDVETAIAPL